MGIRKALRLGIVRGQPHSSDTELSSQSESPICPKEHDIDSLARLLGKSKKWRMAKKTAEMGSRIIGQAMPEGLDDLVLMNALKFHDEECVTGPESKWCHCKWCSERREMLKNGHY